jgi:hypothetical protein
MLDPEVLTVLRCKVNCLLSVTSDTLIHRDSGDAGSGKSLPELVEDHEECQTILSSGHCDCNMVVGAKHVPVTNGSTNFSF